MRTEKKKLILFMTALMLVLSLSVGLTLAYFSDYETVKAEGVVGIGGKTQVVEEYDANEKTVKVKNTGETDVIVRVAVYGPEGMEITAGEGWDKDGDYYYYSEVLTAGAETSEIVAVTEGLLSEDLGDSFDVVVQHESKQVAYDASQKIIVPEDWKDVVNK